MKRKYTYSFDELSNLIAKEKNLKDGDYHFNFTFNGDDEDKLLVVKVSPPKNDVKGGISE